MKMPMMTKMKLPPAAVGMGGSQRRGPVHARTCMAWVVSPSAARAPSPRRLRRPSAPTPALLPPKRRSPVALAHQGPRLGTWRP